jgi:hypothetical protein
MLRSELLEYCERDTKALIELARALFVAAGGDR